MYVCVYIYIYRVNPQPFDSQCASALSWCEQMALLLPDKECARFLMSSSIYICI